MQIDRCKDTWHVVVRHCLQFSLEDQMLGEHQADNGFNTCHPIISVANQGSDWFNLDWFDEVVFPSSSHVYGISSCRAWTCHGHFKQSFFLLATSHLLDVQSLDLYNQEGCRAGRECAIAQLPQVLCISLMDPCLSSTHLIQPVSNWIVFCHAQWTQCIALLVRDRTLCGDDNPTLNCW